MGPSQNRPLWCPKLVTCLHIVRRENNLLHQWFPTFCNAFLSLLILELFIPPLWNFHSFPVRVCNLVLTTIGTEAFVDDNNLIIKSGTKTICCQIVTLKFVNKNVW